MECVGEVLSENTSLCSIGVELNAELEFCIMVRYCNIVTPILKSKISLLRLIAEELWGIRRDFSIFIKRFATNVNGCIIHERVYPQIKISFILDIINFNSDQSINV